MGVVDRPQGAARIALHMAIAARVGASVGFVLGSAELVYLLTQGLSFGTNHDGRLVVLALLTALLVGALAGVVLGLVGALLSRAEAASRLEIGVHYASVLLTVGIILSVLGLAGALTPEALRPWRSRTGSGLGMAMPLMVGLLLLGLTLACHRIVRLSLLVLARVWPSAPRGGWRSVVSASVGCAIVAMVSFASVGSGRTVAHVSRANPSVAALPNVILITLDTVRADHVSAYGYARRTTPALDQFAREALMYTSAYAPSPWTLPSHASLMTGLSPSRHGATRLRRGLFSALGDSPPTLAEILHAKGYATAAVVGGEFCTRPFGLARGFDSYDDRLPTHLPVLTKVVNRFIPTAFALTGKRRATDVNEAVVSWLEGRGQQPFFLFVNYFDAHERYNPPYRYRGEFLDGFGLFTAATLDHNRIFYQVNSGSRQLQRGERVGLEAGYDAEIRYLDAQLQKLLDQLRGLGVYDRSLIVITADHGEPFGEHGLFNHGFTLYEEDVRVPLLIKFPGSRRIGRADHPVSLVDVLPTVLKEVGAPIPDALEGRGGLDDEERPVYLEVRESRLWAKLLGRPLKQDFFAVVRGRDKWIWSSRGTVEHYDLAEDPGEKHNRAASADPSPFRNDPEVVARLAEFLSPPGTTAQPAFDPASNQRLRALGYVQ
jgi:arylsulfatase A-like enzyme